MVITMRIKVGENIKLNYTKPEEGLNPNDYPTGTVIKYYAEFYNTERIDEFFKVINKKDVLLKAKEELNTGYIFPKQINIGIHLDKNLKKFKLEFEYQVEEFVGEIIEDYENEEGYTLVGDKHYSEYVLYKNGNVIKRRTVTYGEISEDNLKEFMFLLSCYGSLQVYISMGEFVYWEGKKCFNASDLNHISINVGFENNRRTGNFEYSITEDYSKMD